MSDYLTDVQLLEAELARVGQAFRGLASSDWHRPTLLQPPSDTLPPWTIFELAGHLDIAIGVTRMLIASQQDGQVGRDRVSFFIFPRVQVAPVFYDYAYTMVAGKSPGQMADVLAETFTRTIAEARAASPELVGGLSSTTATTRSCGWVSSCPAGWSRRSCMAWTSPTRWARTLSPHLRGWR
jgi:hypothetical protein